MGYFIMIVMGLLLIGLGAFKYRDVSGWGFSMLDFGKRMGFSSLKGRL
jgi:hypothetical protein